MGHYDERGEGALWPLLARRSLQCSLVPLVLRCLLCFFVDCLAFTLAFTQCVLDPFMSYFCTYSQIGNFIHVSNTSTAVAFPLAWFELSPSDWFLVF